MPGSRWSKRSLPDGADILICTDGIYVYQRRPQQNVLLELRARNAVVFGSLDPLTADPNRIRAADPIIGSIVTGVYLETDIVLQAGHYKITAEKLYYDFTANRAMVVDAVLRMRLPEPSLPLYVRAQTIRQLSRDHFRAEQLRLSTDEFYLPQTSLRARKADIVTSTPPADGTIPVTKVRTGYDLRHVTANVGAIPIFWWPRAASTTIKPELPLQALHTSHSSEYGFGLESQWSLTWLMGLQEPAGVHSAFRIDEFTERGPALGIDLDYTQQKYRGNLRTYLLNDDGQDRLGNFFTRRDIPAQDQFRGRAKWQHRQYLPRDWQATFEISYLSDPRFLESWHEREFDTAKEQETLLYFKNQRHNWAFDLLNKFHLNDFDYTLTELPTAGFHLVGQDLLQTLTYYHDGYVSRFSERAGDARVSGFNSSNEISQLPAKIAKDDTTFAVSRHELVLPARAGPLNLAPTVIGTFAFDDSAADNTIVQGAFGLRGAMSLWHVNDGLRSRLWDIDRVRHVVTGQGNAFWIEADQEQTNQRHILNLALKQRWQTMRGAPEKQKPVDFLRFDAAVTFINHDQDNVDLPNKFFFSAPEPQFDKNPFLNPDLVNFDLARRQRPNRNLSDHATADLSWLISHNTALTGSANYNLHDHLLSQADATIAVLRSPRTSYHLGNRYLRDGDPFWPGDSHFLTLGGSYKLNRKYTVAAAHQYDLARSVDSTTEAVIIRKVNHWYVALSAGYDVGRNGVSFQISFWHEGLDRFTLGSRRFTHLTP